MGDMRPQLVEKLKDHEYTVSYVESQQESINDILKQLAAAEARVEKLEEARARNETSYANRLKNERDELRREVLKARGKRKLSEVRHILDRALAAKGGDDD